MVSTEQVLDMMCAEESGFGAQKTINTLVKYVPGHIHINSWHDVIQEVNILVLEINLYSVIHTQVFFPLSYQMFYKCCILKIFMLLMFPIFHICNNSKTYLIHSPS